ncbi:membrane protein FAM174A isoform X1 [Lepidochelys kempii]|uniref:membrane protein FAM174A isoform X1 n=1 Tax=Lepidochelys kempii TaxID=8472 RepID=UPI003C6F1523
MPPPRWLLAGLRLLLGALCVEAAAAISETRSTLPQGGTPGEATRSSNGSSSSSSLAVSAPPERNQPMTQRALAVLVVASAALIVYFVIRTVRASKSVLYKPCCLLLLLNTESPPLKQRCRAEYDRQTKRANTQVAGVGVQSLRKRNKKTRRYGVLDTNIENMELTPLEQDDDDDDTTLFDANHPRR